MVIGCEITRFNILFQVGPRREPDLPHVPLWSELGERETQQQILEVLSGDVAVGRPILTAPGAPTDRVQALRKAFDDTVTDPQFIVAAKQANMYINPMGGEEVFEMESINLSFAEEALGAIATKAIERKTGARGLRSIVEAILLDTMFDLPSLRGSRK
jgi:hypothetical protein